MTVFSLREMLDLGIYLVPEPVVHGGNTAFRWHQGIGEYSIAEQASGFGMSCVNYRLLGMLTNFY